MLTLDGRGAPGVSPRGARRQVGRRSETARTPVAAVKAVLPRPGRSENTCLQGPERGIRLYDGMGPPSISN